MSGYTKLFNSILASTIWRADDKTRLVWITLLAMADKRGVVESSVPGLADFARVSLADCQRALRELQAPDEYSRTKEFEGRRIEVVDGGWKLINHGKYREKMGADERREYLKLKQREYREKSRQQQSTTVNKVSDTDTLLTHASPTPEAYTEADPDPVPVTKINLDRKVDAVTKANGNGHNARSKHPIFSGQRFVVFDWMLEDIGRTLGAHLDAFDVHEWFFSLDAKAVKTALVKSKNEWWPWIQQELLAEAQKRGLPMEPPKQFGITKKTAGNAAALKRFAERKTS